MKRFVIIALLLLSSGPAYAELVAVAETFGAKIYVDLETIRSTEGKVEVWAIFDYKRRQRLNDELNYLSIKRLYQYECANEYFRLRATLFFMGNMGTGHVVQDSFNEDIWRLVPSAGVGRTLMELACKAKK